MTSITAGFTDPAAAGFGARGGLIANATQVRERLDTLTRQASSGRVSDSFAGLGTGAATTLSLRPALTRITAWQDNINAVDGRMQVAQSSLEQISAIASNFRARTADLNGLSTTMIDSVAASARDALRQVAGLLNARHGDQYVFAGQDSANAPVPGAESILSSGFATAIAASVAGLATNGAATTIAATLTTARSNVTGTSPFSAQLSQPVTALAAIVPTAPVGDGTSVQVGILASANADATSTGSSTTGSYSRDVLRALATLGSLDSSQVGVAGFGALVADVRSSLEGAITALNIDAGVMGDRQSTIRDSKQRLDETSTVLLGQVADVEDVDMAETLSKLTLTQTQLQSSYQLLAGLQSLSLTKFLSPS